MNIADRLTICAIWLFLAGGLLREILGQTALVTFSFYTFHCLDPAVVVATIATFAHLARGRLDWRPYSASILAMAVLIAINSVRGLAVDPAAALLWIRINVGLASFLALAVAMRPLTPIMDAARKGLLICSIMLGFLLLIRLATHPTLFMTLDISDADANDGGRALSAQGAFLMVLASGLVTTEILQRRRIFVDGLALLAIALPVLILLTRQGTANIAEFFVLATLVFLQRGRSQVGRILWGGAGLVVLFGVVALTLPMLSDNADLARRSITLDGRREIWAALLHMWPSQTPIIQLFGFAAGQQPTLAVWINGGYRDWSLSIHSMFYGSLPAMGYVGAFAYVLTLGLLLWSTLAGTLRRTNPISAFPFACCAATAIFSYSYEIRNDGLIGLFIAIWWLRYSDWWRAGRGDQPDVLARRSAIGRRGVPVRLDRRA